MDILITLILVLGIIAGGIDYLDCKDKYIVATIRATTVVLILTFLLIGLYIEVHGALLSRMASMIVVN